MQHRQGALSFDAAFHLTQPWTVLFGPSGSGKTTVLRAIAGLMRPAAGRIVLHGAATATLFDSTTGASLPAYRRGVRLAAQVAALFPNMTVRQNIAYGVPSTSAEIVEEALQRFRLCAARLAANPEEPAMEAGGVQAVIAEHATAV